MAFALTEPTAGSHPPSLASAFKDKGNHFVLWKKHWIGNATIVDLTTTYAKEIGGNLSNMKNISAFLIYTNSRGISTREMKNKIGMLTEKCRIRVLRRVINTVIRPI